jgi:hypothetical protein
MCPVSCVRYVASFSGLSFFIAPSVFSNIYLNTDRQIKKDNPEKLEKYGTQDTGQINVGEYRRGYEKGQSRETGNIGYTPTLIIKSRDASVILIPTLIDKSHDPSNELIRIIFYTKVCNINSDAD